MMRIAICDDEKNIRELIGNKVAKQNPDAKIVFFSSGEELFLSEEKIYKTSFSKYGTAYREIIFPRLKGEINEYCKNF